MFNEVAVLNIGNVHNVAQTLIVYLHLVRVRITITWCNTQHITDNKSNNNEINMIVSIYNCFFFLTKCVMYFLQCRTLIPKWLQPLVSSKRLASLV